MNMEIAKHKMHLAEMKAKLREQRNRAENLIISARDKIDPYVDDVTLLDTEAAVVAVTDLHNLVVEARELKLKIERLERDLA